MIIKTIFWFFIFVLIYIYIGYPCLLFLISRIKKTHPLPRTKIYPKVSLIIAAYNEENVIRKRIENILTLDYPKDNLEVIIASDGSTDKTNDIVLEYKKNGIILNLLPQRKGKMAALNETVKKANGDILIFSDADILFKNDNIEKLVHSFVDPAVGCVSGIKKIIDIRSSAESSENLYWKYEFFLKLLENKIGSLVSSVIGCNFAIRKNLYVPLEEKTTAEDLALPIICISQGYKVVMEPHAISYEKLVPDFKTEFLRKIRIIKGGLHAIGSVKNKIKYLDKLSFFELFSHKVLRWYAPFFLIGTLLVNSLLQHGFYLLFLFFQIIFYFLSLIGWFIQDKNINFRVKILNKIFSIPFYFSAMNAASLIGIFEYTLKKHKGWVSWEKEMIK